MSNTTTETRQDIFVRVFLPVLTKRFAYHFRRLDPEAAAEATQDCTAIAWQRFQQAGDRAWDGSPGERTGKMTPTILGDFTARSFLSEGRVFGGSSILDVYAHGTQRRGRVSLRHLDGDRLTPLHGEIGSGAPPAALLTKNSTNPLTRVRVSSDWRTIALHCRPKAQRVLAMLARGFKPTEIARSNLSISPGRVSQLKTEIAAVAASLGYGPRRWEAA